MNSNSQATAPQAVTVKPARMLLKSVFVCISLFAVMGFVGTLEYHDELYYSIPDAAFEEIILKLGDHADRQEVIKEYLSDRSFYDNL
ncbi:hypothetical protein [Parabacteroides goldsteinii]|uniref:hypothetical protein n=1 Tax=Parabacteroides goldsteinii TaxID=328812 RepID=UPI002675049D|nr:hypothetical protein [Parabacteroides goldsteinii]